ncbi:MAG: SMP-30/gluconolactonase/LRE family protein [Pseudomonadota bacterium]
MASENYEILDPRFQRLVKTAEPLQELWTGGSWTEGPVWLPAMKSLVWSDIPSDRRLKWDALTDQTVEMRAGEGAYVNGSTLDRQGRIIMCEHGTRTVTRLEHDGGLSVLAESYGGKRLNSPNDVVVRSDGTIWFTDPAYGIESDYEGYAAAREQDGEHVYRIDPDGTLTRVTDDFVAPNGLAFSLDERQLYIVDSGGSRGTGGPRHIRLFDVQDDLTLKGGEVFATCDAGVFDGFRLDTKGRIWTSAGDGVHCYDPDGSLIGKILVPQEVSNLCFGGYKRNRLFITATSSLYSVLICASGAKTV